MLTGLCRWGQQRDETFKRGLARLRQDIIRANRLAREAGLLAAELGYTATSYSVTLQVGGVQCGVRCATAESPQIPPHNLTPHRRPGSAIRNHSVITQKPHNLHF